MPKKTKDEVVSPEQVLDPILASVATAFGPIADQIDRSENHAILVVSAKYEDDVDGHGPGVQTFNIISGYQEFLEEALFLEIRDQMTNGDLSLFSILREVVRDLEEEFDIDPEDELEQPNGTSSLH